MVASRASEAENLPLPEDRQVPDVSTLARVEALLEEARFEVKLGRETNARLTQELNRLEQRLVARSAEADALRGRLSERERYVNAIHGSIAWKAIEAVRGLLGRRWSG